MHALRFLMVCGRRRPRARPRSFARDGCRRRRPRPRALDGADRAHTARDDVLGVADVVSIVAVGAALHVAQLARAAAKNLELGPLVGGAAYLVPAAGADDATRPSLVADAEETVADRLRRLSIDEEEPWEEEPARK